jgi:hypothetical protein
MKPSPLAVIVCALGASASAFRDVARHSWIVANVRERTSTGGAHRHRRYEWLGDASATDSDNPFDYFGSGEVAIHGVVLEHDAHDAKSMDAMIACLDQATKSYTDANCGCWPGPNSNTFVDGLIRTCGLGIELPATALGRDYRGVVGASVTEGRTGVQLETWIGGAKLGLKEGVSADPRACPSARTSGRQASTCRSTQDASVSTRAFDASPIRPPPIATPGRRASGSSTATARRASTWPSRTTTSRTHRVPVVSPIEPRSGVVLGDMGFIAATSGIGTAGVSSSVRGALELPEELRIELDFARIARLGLHGGIVVVPTPMTATPRRRSSAREPGSVRALRDRIRRVRATAKLLGVALVGAVLVGCTRARVPESTAPYGVRLLGAADGALRGAIRHGHRAFSGTAGRDYAIEVTNDTARGCAASRSPRRASRRIASRLPRRRSPPSRRAVTPRPSVPSRSASSR